MNKKVILITGASSGIGYETAKDLIVQGYTVYASARRVERMSKLEDLGGYVLNMDVTKEADVQKVVETVISNEGKIDVLWNNAGFGLFGSIEETSLDDARYQFEVNLFGLASITQKVTPHMRKAGEGLIINTSSMCGRMYASLGAWYHATKHALEGWSDCLRVEVKDFGIRVVILEPGAIQTEFAEVMVAPMIERSGQGAYKKLADALKKMIEKELDNVSGSPSSVISRTVQKIIKAKRTSTRYLVGKYAKPMVYIREIAGDRVFDKIINLMLNQY